MTLDVRLLRELQRTLVDVSKRFVVGMGRSLDIARPALERAAALETAAGLVLASPVSGSASAASLVREAADAGIALVRAILDGPTAPFAAFARDPGGLDAVLSVLRRTQEALGDSSLAFALITLAEDALALRRSRSL